MRNRGGKGGGRWKKRIREGEGGRGKPAGRPADRQTEQERRRQGQKSREREAERNREREGPSPGQAEGRKLPLGMREGLDQPLRGRRGQNWSKAIKSVVETGQMRSQLTIRMRVRSAETAKKNCAHARRS